MIKIKIAVFAALGSLLLAFVLVWLMTRIRYRITPHHFQVTLLGLKLRQIPLDTITSVSKRRPSAFSEKWHNTTRPAHCTLTIRRSKGICKNIVITPRNRYVFKTDLERAIQRVSSPEESEQAPIIVTD